MTQIIRQIACPIQFQKHSATKPYHVGGTLLIATAFGAGSFATLMRYRYIRIVKFPLASSCTKNFVRDTY